MKNRVFFAIVFLIVSTIACNFPLLDGDVWGVSSVSVSPQSGSGQFEVSVQGSASPGKSSLACYVSSKNGNNLVVFQKALYSPTARFMSSHNYFFDESFTFEYTDPGAHSLVCWLDDTSSSAWSDDFVVTQSGTPENTPTSTSTPALTATIIPAFTVFGSFVLQESSLDCGDGSHSPNPASAIPGTLEITVNYATRMASATIEGSSGDVIQSSCSSKPYTLRYDIANSTITGTVNPDTGELVLSGDVKHSFWNSCYTESGSSCTAGGQSDITVSVTLTGTVDPVNHSAAGKIKFGLNPNWGNWQAK